MCHATDYAHLTPDPCPRCAHPHEGADARDGCAGCNATRPWGPCVGTALLRQAIEPVEMQLAALRARDALRATWAQQDRAAGLADRPTTTEGGLL